MVAGPERLGDVGAGPARADRQTVAERLRHRDDVGADVAAVLEPEPAAGAPEPGLHLVDDEQRLALVAEPADRLEVAGRRGLHAAFALDRLEQDRADPLVHRRGQRVEIGELDLAEARRQRLERLLLLGLAGRRERAERAAVERVVRREHVEALGTAVGLAVAGGRA